MVRILQSFSTNSAPTIGRPLTPLGSDSSQSKNISPGSNLPSPFSSSGKKNMIGAIKKVGQFAVNNLPAIGATAGAIGGGAIGAFGGPAGIYAGAVTGSAAGGALGEAGKEKIQGKSLSPKNIGEQAFGMGATEAIGGPVLNLAGKAIESIGKEFAESVIPTSTREASLLQTYKANKPFLERMGNVLGFGKSTVPMTSASTSFEKGLMGTESMIGVQAKRASSSLWKDLISPQLEKSDVKIDMPTFFDEAEKNITKNTPELGDQTARTNAMNAIKEDYAKKPVASLKELQDFKKGWASHVPEKYYKGKDITQTYNNARAELANLARTKIYDSLGPEVKQAYFDYGNLQAIQELGQKAMTGAKFKGGTGAMFNAIKDMALTPVGTIGGQTIYKAGQGIELLGNPNARIVRDLFVPSDNKNEPKKTTTNIFSKQSQ